MIVNIAGDAGKGAWTGRGKGIVLSEEHINGEEFPDIVQKRPECRGKELRK